MNESMEKQLPIALIKLTQKKTIHWEILDVYEHANRLLLLFDDGIVDGYIYQSIVNDKTVLLFRFTYKYTDEFGTSHRDFSYRLVISDPFGIPETEIDDKYKYSLDILYDIVRESCHNVSNWAREVVEWAK
jgi:hypothetical protein